MSKHTKYVAKGNTPDDTATVEVRAKITIDSMEARNLCPSCNSDFVLDKGIKWITWNRVQRDFECTECGKTFSHIYKLIYDQSIID